MLETENMDNRLFLELKSRIIKRALDKVHIPFERATKFCEIFNLLLSYVVVPVKSKVKISQNFVAFSEYMNFILFPGSNKLELLFGFQTWGD